MPSRGHRLRAKLAFIDSFPFTELYHPRRASAQSVTNAVDVCAVFIT